MKIDGPSFSNFVTSRRSERQMWPAPIPAADLEAIVNCGLWAPSGSNQQPWHFVVITNRPMVKEFAAAVGAKVNEIRDRISSASAQRSFDGYTRYLTFFADASALVAAFVEPYRALLERLLARYAPELSVSTRENASLFSVAAAIENMLLAAHAYGYAGCWLTGPLIAKDEIEAKIRPAGSWELASLVALGARLPDREPATAPPRRARDETVTFIP